MKQTFAPAVLGGLAGSGLLAWGGNRDLVVVDAPGATHSLAADTALQAPLLAALGLVGLAAWGALLLTRGVVRRVVAVVAALAATGALVAAVHALRTLPGQVEKDYLERGATTASATPDAWMWVCLAASVLALSGAGIAVLSCRTWPEMGGRYDAPSSPSHARDLSGSDERSLWKSIDEGRDPTLDAEPLD